MNQVPNDKTCFRNVWAGKSDHEFRVGGKLRLKGMTTKIPSSVEVALVDGAGKVIEARTVEYCPSILIDRKGSREARFSASFSQMPPPGTVIRLNNVN